MNVDKVQSTPLPSTNNSEPTQDKPDPSFAAAFERLSGSFTDDAKTNTKSYAGFVDDQTDTLDKAASTLLSAEDAKEIKSLTKGADEGVHNAARFANRSLDAVDAAGTDAVSESESKGVSPNDTIKLAGQIATAQGSSSVALGNVATTTTKTEVSDLQQDVGAILDRAQAEAGSDKEKLDAINQVRTVVDQLPESTAEVGEAYTNAVESSSAVYSGGISQFGQPQTSPAQAQPSPTQAQPGLAQVQPSPMNSDGPTAAHSQNTKEDILGMLGGSPNELVQAQPSPAQAQPGPMNSDGPTAVHSQVTEEDMLGMTGGSPSAPAQAQPSPAQAQPSPAQPQPAPMNSDGPTAVHSQVTEEDMLEMTAESQA